MGDGSPVGVLKFAGRGPLIMMTCRAADGPAQPEVTPSRRYARIRVSVLAWRSARPQKAIPHGYRYMVCRVTVGCDKRH